MAYKIVIKTLAEHDITEAVEYYLKHAPHLIGKFVSEINIAADLLRKNPHQFQKRYKTTRVIYTNTFPFSIYYTIEDKTVFVHAVLHSRRDPKTGTERI